MNNVFYYESSHLEHHGIKGQRWGIRRYQNPDGSLTAAGKRRVQKTYRQHNIVMRTTSGQRKLKKEIKKLDRMKEKLTEAETDELVRKLEKDEAIRRLTAAKADDKIEKGLKYLTGLFTIGMTASSIINNVSNIKKNAATTRSTDATAAKITQEARAKKVEADKAKYEFNKQKKADRASAITNNVKAASTTPSASTTKSNDTRSLINTICYSGGNDYNNAAAISKLMFGD